MTIWWKNFAAGWTSAEGGSLRDAHIGKPSLVAKGALDFSILRMDSASVTPSAPVWVSSHSKTLVGGSACHNMWPYLLYENHDGSVTFSNHLSLFPLKDKLRVGFALFPLTPFSFTKCSEPLCSLCRCSPVQLLQEGSIRDWTAAGQPGLLSVLHSSFQHCNRAWAKIIFPGAYLLPLQAHNHPTVLLQVF